MSELEAAINWWNSSCGPSYKISVDDGKIQLPPVETIIYVFSRISPFLTITLDNCSTFSEPWERIFAIMNKLFPEANEIKNPQQDFSDFLVFLYFHRNQLAIDTPEKVISVIDCFKFVKRVPFLFWNVPEALDNSFLYFSTLYEMLVIKSSFMSRLLNSPGSVDVFFDRFLPIIEEVEPNISKAIIEVLTKLISDRMHSICHVDETITKFYDKLIKIIADETKGIELNVTCFRSATVIITTTKSYFSTRNIVKMLDTLINATFNIPWLHTITMKFAMDLNLTKGQFTNFIRNMLKKENLSVERFNIIDDLLNTPNLEKKFSIIQSLFAVAANEKFWSKICTKVFIRALIPIADKQEVQKWLVESAKKTFLFVGAAASLKKYVNKRTSIILMHDAIYKLKIEAYNADVKRMYSSLVNSRMIQKMEVDIPIEKTTDFRFLRDVECAASKKNVKQILSTNEAVESTTSKGQRSKGYTFNKSPRPAITKPSSKKSFARRGINMAVSRRKIALTSYAIGRNKTKIVSAK